MGETLGFRRYRSGYVAGSTPKLVLLRPLVPDACRRLSAARLDRGAVEEKEFREP